MPLNALMVLMVPIATNSTRAPSLPQTTRATYNSRRAHSLPKTYPLLCFFFRAALFKPSFALHRVS